MATIFEQLKAPFPRDVVSWRAQSVTNDGTKALALAYIDARDVENRLDDAAGPENWQDSYVETAKGRILSTIQIRVDGEWISKSDGAGDTDVEGDKGAISDAFKRAAVKWGIGRYLYDMPNVWVPCESYEKNGKKHWKAWKADPWSFVRNSPEPSSVTDAEARAAEILTLAKAAGVAIQTICESYSVSALDELTDLQAQKVKNRLNATIKDIADKQKEAANGR